MQGIWDRPKFLDIPSPHRRFQKFPGEKKLHFPRSGKTKRDDRVARDRESAFNSSGRSTRETSFQFRPSPPANKISAACFSIFSHLFPTSTTTVCFHVCELTIQRLVRVYRYRNTPLLHEETRGKRGLDGPSIVCRIFYSIRVAAFLPPRTFLRRRQYSFEPLQPSVESVYKVAWCVCVCIPIEKRNRGISQEIQFKTYHTNSRRPYVFIFRSFDRIFDENDRND